jgi:hypothetical protein
MSSHHPGHHLRPIRDLFGTFWTDFGSNLDPNQTRKMSNTVPGHKYGTGRRKYGTGRHKYGTARHTYQLNFQTSKFPACSMIWPGGMREAIKSAAPCLWQGAGRVLNFNPSSCQDLESTRSQNIPPGHDPSIDFSLIFDGRRPCFLLYV